MKGCILSNLYSHYQTNNLPASLWTRQFRGTPRSSKLPRHLLARNNMRKAKEMIYRKVCRAKLKPAVNVRAPVNDVVLDISAADSLELSTTSPTNHPSIPPPTNPVNDGSVDQPILGTSPPLTPTLSMSSSASIYSTASLSSPVTPSPHTFSSPQILDDGGYRHFDEDLEAGRNFGDSDKRRRFKGSLLFSSATTKAASFLGPLSPTTGAFVSTMSNLFRPSSPRLDATDPVDESFHCMDAGSKPFSSANAPTFFVYKDVVPALRELPGPRKPVRENILTPSNGKTHHGMSSVYDHVVKEADHGTPKRAKHLSHSARRPPTKPPGIVLIPPSARNSLVMTPPGKGDGPTSPPTPPVIAASPPLPATRPLQIVKKNRSSSLPPITIPAVPPVASYIPKLMSPSSSSDLPYLYVRAYSPPPSPPSSVTSSSSWDVMSFLERGEVDFGHGTVVVDQHDDIAYMESDWRIGPSIGDYSSIVYTACV